MKTVLSFCLIVGFFANPIFANECQNIYEGSGSEVSSGKDIANIKTFSIIDIPASFVDGRGNTSFMVFWIEDIRGFMLKDSAKATNDMLIADCYTPLDFMLMLHEQFNVSVSYAHAIKVFEKRDFFHPSSG